MENKRASEKPKASWGKRIGLALGLLVLLLVVVYFVGTSSAFVKAVILPRVGAALNAKVTAEAISVSPFSQLHIQKLRVVTTGAEPLLTADDVRVRYSLTDIIGGNINVQEMTMISPVMTIVEEANGASNLDPILNREKKAEPEKPGSNEPTKLSIQNVTLKNGIVRQIQKTKEGGVNRTELQNINLSLDRLGNGQSGKLNLAAAFSMEQKHGATNNVLTGEISGGYDLALNQELMPSTIKGSTKLAITRGNGAFQDLAGFNTSLDADLSPTEIKEVALKFTKGAQQLGQVRVSGPMNLEKKEGNLKLEVLSLDKNILALATAGKGMDFRNSAINSTNQVTISKNGTFYALNGNLAGTKISVAQEKMTTPEIDLGAAYQLTVNTAEKSALVEKFNVTGLSGGKEFLRTTLDQQMNLSWGETVKGYKDAALRVVLTNFNLAEWRAVLGTNLQAGVVNSTVALVSQKDGRVLNTEMNAMVSGFAANFGSNRIQNATMNFQSSSTVEDLKIINLTRYALTLQQNDNPVLQASGAARYLTETKEATAQLTAEGQLARLLAVASVPGASASAGVLKVSANYTEAKGKRTANGTMGIEGFTGKQGEYSFTNFLAAFDYNVEIENQLLEIHRASAKFAQGLNAGGNLELKGKYNLEKNSGQFTFQTVDLNQNTFAPVLAPSLGENRLVSISLNASGEAKVDPAAESSLKADIKVANWVVADKEGKLPTNPLGVDLKVDGGMRQEVVDLRQMLVQLTPTARARNALQVQAKLDLSKTNAGSSTMTVRSESLDVTPYYDIFRGGKTNAAKAQAAVPPANSGATASTGVDKEPEPMALPLQQLAADLKIDRLYLRQIAVSNWVGNVTIRSNVVQLNPFKLEINGGTMNVTGNFDVGKPGYAYQLGFNAKEVPLAPLANSLDLVNSNQLQGTFIADAHLRGAGITGPNLKKNLGGNIGFNLTNINYVVGGPKLRRILVPISLALRAPELAETPINWFAAQARITNGVVQVENAAVESEAFFATLAGTITLENVISNSTMNLPMDFSIRRSLAAKAKILPANTPEDAKYAKLGNIYSIRGTVGNPDPDANKTALGLIAAQGVAGAIGDERIGNVVGAVGSIFGGNKSAGTNNTGTATNNASSRLGGVLEAVGGLLGNSAKTTNTAPAGKGATNAPPATQPRQNPLGDLLRSLPGTKQQ